MEKPQRSSKERERERGGREERTGGGGGGTCDDHWRRYWQNVATWAEILMRIGKSNQRRASEKRERERERERGQDRGRDRLRVMHKICHSAGRQLRHVSSPSPIPSSSSSSQMCRSLKIASRVYYSHIFFAQCRAVGCGTTHRQRTKVRPFTTPTNHKKKPLTAKIDMFGASVKKVYK